MGVAPECRAAQGITALPEAERGTTPAKMIPWRAAAIRAVFTELSAARTG